MLAVKRSYCFQLLEKEQSGCFALLRDDKVEDLSRMYRLFSKIDRGLDPVSCMFKQADKRDLVGMQEHIFIKKVIELHDKYMAYENDCFDNHTLFHKALKDAFEVFCNKGVSGSSSAELLANFCDNILKKGGSEKLSDEVIEEILEKVEKLLAYVSDKDHFAEFYRKKLAPRRLLFDKSANDDHERSILTKLKQQCGGQFTSKMEGTVTDLTLARENQTSFEEYLNNKPNASTGIDLTVTVLTTGFWSSYKSFDLNLPAKMHIAGRLEGEGDSSDHAVRNQNQTESVQVGLAILHLGSLLLELGRTTLTPRMGQSPAESLVNARPAVYISPSGPNPLMVQPFPLQTSSLFGGAASCQTYLE